MNLFKQLESGRTFPPRRILLYGIHGIGASSFAAGLLAPVFVPADQSTSGVNCQRFPAARRFADLMTALEELYIEAHDYRTVVVDPLGAVEGLIREAVCRERGVKQLADAPRAGKDLLIHWRRLLRRLDLLRSDIDLHVVLVGHAREPRACSASDNSERAPQQNRGSQCYRPAVSRSASALLQSWCDEVLFATHATLPPAGNLSPTCAAASVAGGEPGDRVNDLRVIHTTPTALYVAKNHLNLPLQLPMRPEALMPYLHPASASSHVPSSNLN